MSNPKINHQQLIESMHGIIADSAANRDEKLQRICDLLADKIEVFDWVGFYLSDPDAEEELILGPFVGEGTEHTHISFGVGICGQAAASKETFVVQDVDEANNYLSCSVNVKAEIVAPVMKDNHFVAELDIDSHKKDSISDELRELVEKVCDITAEIF
jgi:GAF domain-containing protein